MRELLLNPLGLFRDPYVKAADNVRYKMLVGYCIFQMAYTVCMIFYGMFYETGVQVFILSALTIIPPTLAVIYYARYNYRLAGGLYAIYGCLLQTAYLFFMQNAVSMTIIAVMVYLLIASMVSTVFSIRGGVLVILIGAAALLANEAIGDNISRAPIDDHTPTPLVHVMVYSITLFGFISYLVSLFREYLEQYLKQSEVADELNRELKRTIASLNDTNCRLEEHVSALTDANRKLNRYAWSHSHELRAPVARILGLMNLIRLDGKLGNDPDTPRLVSAISTTANELDDVLQKMSLMLNEIDPRRYE